MIRIELQVNKQSIPSRKLCKSMIKKEIFSSLFLKMLFELIIYLNTTISQKKKKSNIKCIISFYVSSSSSSTDNISNKIDLNVSVCAYQY
jgi:hypothetical protein